MKYRVITKIPGGMICDIVKSLDVLLDITYKSMRDFGNVKIEKIEE